VNAETATPPPLPAMRAPAVVLAPSFGRAWRGLWRLTWKNQLTWRSGPWLFIRMLILPAVVFFMLAPATGIQRTLWVEDLADPGRQVSYFRNNLQSIGIHLPSEKRKQLQTIFTEEYARADEEWRRNSTGSASAVEEQNRYIRACYDRIRDRAADLLSERELAQLSAFGFSRIEANTTRLNSPRWNRPSAFYHALINLYFLVVLPLNCVRACGGLIRDELQADTLSFLLTRPIHRATLLVIKYLCQVLWLELLAVIQAALLFAIGHLFKIPELGSLALQFLGVQFIAVLVWSALGTLFGQITKRYVAMAIIYGLIVEMGIGRIPTNINTLSVMRHLKALLSHNIELQDVFEWTSGGLVSSTAILLLMAALFLGAAAALFTYLEYHPTAEMQK